MHACDIVRKRWLFGGLGRVWAGSFLAARLCAGQGWLKKVSWPRSCSAAVMRLAVSVMACLASSVLRCRFRRVVVWFDDEVGAGVDLGKQRSVPACQALVVRMTGLTGMARVRSARSAAS